MKDLAPLGIVGLLCVSAAYIGTQLVDAPPKTLMVFGAFVLCAMVAARRMR